SELLLQDGHQYVDGERHPHLSLDGVLGGAIKSFDAKMLFDPAKEQFHMPAGAVEVGDGERQELKIVGEKDQAHNLFGVEEVNAPQRSGIPARALGSGEANGLI